ncbi:HTH domain-containing protein [Haloarchaeobius sp. HRN-SO-5]|uniref:HTH domain-containing protein n=1 Tax=Haloarchaeobius sp. HRN-SO-5 TaxID=3446118 RepID=UPI003EBC5AC4
MNKFEPQITGNTIRIELYVCASMHGTYEKQCDAIDEIESLVDAGTVDEFERHVWAHRLTPAADDEWCSRARQKYREYDQWARSSGWSLSPAFSKRTVTNEFVGEEYEVIQFPVISVAIYADDQLVRVAPAIYGEEHYSVEDCLEELTSLEQTSSQPVPVGVDSN